MSDMFFPGMVFGAVFGWLLTVLIISAPHQRMQDACEAKLPRDQKCVMQFVPQPSKD